MPAQEHGCGASRWRLATGADVDGLTDLEQVAYETSLGHLFEGYPFPWDDIAADWRRRLAEPSMRIEVIDRGGRLAAYLCYDDERLHRLAVHPDDWGRGLARAAIERAAGSIAVTGREPVLWCLADNARARRVYEHLGWVLSGRTGRSEYPPYHHEVEYILGAMTAPHAPDAPTMALPDAGTLIPLEGALNTREIAGFRTADGRRIKSGIVYRSSALSYLTASDRATLQGLDIRTVLDFRGPQEQSDAPDRLPAGAVSISAPIDQDDLDFAKITTMLDRAGFSRQMHDQDKVNGYGPFYRMFALVNSYGDPDFLPKLAAYKTMFDQLLDPHRNGAILMHCTGGRDRTGIATAILLRTLGVPEKTIEANYLASNTLLQPDRDDPESTSFERFAFSNVFVQPTTNHAFQKAAADLGETPKHLYDAVRLRAQYLRTLWRTIDERYGSFGSFIAREYNLTPDRVTRLRDLMTA